MSETLSELDVANAATTTTGAEAGAEATPAAVPGAAEATQGTEAAPTSAPAEPNWDDINVLNAAAERIAALGYSITPVTAEPEPEPQYDNEYDAKLAALEQQVQTLAQAQAQAAAAEANDLVNTRIELAIDAAQLSPAEGQTPEQLHSAVNAIANGFAAQKLAALGRQPFGAEAQRIGDEAITEAVAFLNAHRSVGKAQGVEEYKQALTSDGSHLLDPPVRGAGIEGTQPAVSELDVARRFVDANRNR